MSKGISRQEAWEWIEANGNAGDLPSEVEVVVHNYTARRTGAGIPLPEGVVLASDESPVHWPHKAKRYLAVDRHLTFGQVMRWNIGYAIEGSQRNRIVIPIRNEFGQVSSYTGRTFTKAPLRYKEPKLEDGADPAAIFGVEHWGAADDVVVITEGAFNALAVERVIPSHWRVAALYGSNLVPRHLLRLSRFKNVLLATDADGAGNRVSLELSEQLGGSASTSRVIFPPKVDCDDLPPEDLRLALNAAYDKLAA